MPFAAGSGCRRPWRSGGIESQIATSYPAAYTAACIAVSYLAFTVKNGRGPPFPAAGILGATLGRATGEMISAEHKTRTTEWDDTLHLSLCDAADVVFTAT